jgi:hypothetical protein
MGKEVTVCKIRTENIAWPNHCRRTKKREKFFSAHDIILVDKDDPRGDYPKSRKRIRFSLGKRRPEMG